MLTVVDTLSHFVPLIDPKFSYRGEDVVDTDRNGLIWEINPKGGSEFISLDIYMWAYQRGVILDYSRPGKPTDNAFIEAFNSKLRSECLNVHWFLSLQGVCENAE
jgi:putative transposase